MNTPKDIEQTESAGAVRSSDLLGERAKMLKYLTSNMPSLTKSGETLTGAAMLSELETWTDADLFSACEDLSLLKAMRRNFFA